MEKTLTVCFLTEHFLSNNNYFSFISQEQFFNYFFPTKYKYNIIDKSENADITIVGVTDLESDDDNLDTNSINILISVENCNKWTWYKHYNKYGNYGNEAIDIYYYNHIQSVEYTNKYVAIPTLHAYINYYNNFYNDHIIENPIEFANKKFGLVINKSNLNMDIYNCITILSEYNFDHISIYNNEILHKSCYHSMELLKVFNKYKFIICFENSYNTGYVTEKIFNCFFAKTIPIYLGDPDICKYINPESFIDARSNNWHERLKELNENEILYNKAINANKFIDTYNNENYKSLLETKIDNKLNKNI